jgi:hypothetical protein
MKSLLKLLLPLLLILLSACTYNSRYDRHFPGGGYYPNYGNNRYYPPQRSYGQPRPPVYGNWRNMRPNPPVYRPPNNNYYYNNNYYNRPAPPYYGNGRNGYRDHGGNYNDHDRHHGHGHRDWHGDRD